MSKEDYRLCFSFHMISLFITVLVLILVIPIGLLSNNNGCYIKNGIGICNFDTADVMITNYSCAPYVNNCYPGCDCNSCTNSIYCNCDLIQCNIMGTYVDTVLSTDCKIVVKTHRHSHDKFSYDDTHEKFKINHTYSLFTKSDNNKCYTKNKVIEYGKRFYNFAVAGIFLVCWLVFGCVAVQYESHLLIHYDDDKKLTQNNILTTHSEHA